MRFEELQAATPSSALRGPPAPLLPMAIGLIAGIALDNLIPVPVFGSIGLFAVGGVLIFRNGSSDGVRFVALVIAAMGLGTLRHAVADRWIAADHMVHHTQAEPILVHLSGEILDKPEVAEPRPDAVTAYEIGPKTRFVIEANTIAGRDGPIPVSGRVAVTVKAPILTLRPGDRIAMTGWLYRPRGPRNPGEYDWALHQRRNGIRAGLVCDHAESVQVSARTASAGWSGTLAGLRAQLRGYVIDTAFDDDDPGAGVIAAMVLAQRSAVDRATNNAFIKTGNAHLLAASGMNIAWLAAIGWFVMRLFEIHYRIATLVIAALILTYVLLAEPEPSILRAGIGGMLWCLCIFLRGRTNPLNWLACSAIVILMIDPMEAFRPGFQYSFLAVLGLLHFSPYVARAFAALCLRINLPRLASNLDRTFYAAKLMEPTTEAPNIALSVFDWLAFRLLALFAVSFSAWFVTAPLSCHIFNILNPWGAICTFLVVFLALPVTCIGYVATILGSLFPSSGHIVSPILSATTHAMLHLVEWLAGLPGMAIDGRHPSTIWLSAVYVVLWLRVYRPHWITGDKPGVVPDVKDGEREALQLNASRTPASWRKHAFTGAAILLFLWWLIPHRWTTFDRNAFKVWMLAVGDGTGTVIELPNGKVLIYDFGTRSAFDAGPLAVSFLNDRGIDQIDAVFVTHTDFDHRSAIVTIGKQIPIGRIIINDQFERFAPPKSDPRQFLDAVARLQIPVETWSGPHMLADTGEVRIESIWPPAAQDRRLAEANESSMVLKVTYQDRILLLTGDIAETAIGSLLSAAPGPTSLHADALAIPHHGSVVANTGRFISTVDPRVAVRSTGQRRGLTTNRIEQLIASRTYFSTADDGCILLTIRDGRLSAEAVTRPSDTR